MKEKIFNSIRILGAVFFLGIAVADAKQLGSDLDIKISTIKAKEIAIKILSKAMRNSEITTEVADKFLFMRDVLMKRDIMWQGRGLLDFKFCKKDYLGYVEGSYYSKIYLCKETLTENPDYIAQVLIHESAHLSGVVDECETTRLEVTAFSLAEVELTHKNGYMDDCGIK